MKASFLFSFIIHCTFSFYGAFDSNDHRSLIKVETTKLHQRLSPLPMQLLDSTKLTFWITDCLFKWDFSFDPIFIFDFNFFFRIPLLYLCNCWIQLNRETTNWLDDITYCLLCNLNLNLKIPSLYMQHAFFSTSLYVLTYYSFLNMLLNQICKNVIQWGLAKVLRYKTLKSMLKQKKEKIGHNLESW